MSEWISVSDRLPEEGESVWVYDKKPSIEYGRDVHTAMMMEFGFGVRWLAGDDGETDPQDINPTHWMPITRPEPPK